MNENNIPAMPPPSSNGKIAVICGVVVALGLIGSNVYLYSQLDKVKLQSEKTQEKILNELTNIRESSSVTSQTSRKNLDKLRDELETARRQATMAVGQVKVDANKHAEQLASKLASEQAKQSQLVKTEITEVRQSATAANTKIGEVSADVGTVKTEFASTKAELDKTIAGLKRVVGDVEGQGSLIATNGKELQALKALGERNFFEFTIAKAKQPNKVGDITIQLKKTDPKKNKYTIEVVADDKLVEKKDKNTNEPVQFYVLSKARQPWEIVVNKVEKDKITGYLSTPKVQIAR